jgi:hypothetical protein
MRDREARKTWERLLAEYAAAYAAFDAANQTRVVSSWRTDGRSVAAAEIAEEETARERLLNVRWRMQEFELKLAEAAMRVSPLKKRPRRSGVSTRTSEVRS